MYFPHKSMTSTYMFVPSAISMLCISGCAFLLTTVAKVSYLTLFSCMVQCFFVFFVLRRSAQLFLKSSPQLALTAMPCETKKWTSRSSSRVKARRYSEISITRHMEVKLRTQRHIVESGPVDGPVVSNLVAKKKGSPWRANG